MEKKVSGSSQVKFGALFSYVLIIGNAVFGLLVTPMIVKSLGDSEYGVYKSIGSFVSSMMVLDLGIGGTLMRYISKYRAKKEDDKIPDFVSMMAAETGVVLLVASIVLIVIYFFIESIFGEGFSDSEILLGKKLFILQGILLVLHIISNFINGIITGYNNFLLGNGTKLFRLTLKICLTILLLAHYKSAILLVSLEIILTLLVIIFEMSYVLGVYKIRFNFAWRRWDFSVFKESLLYTAKIFLTTIAAQVNNNLDNVIIGAISGPEMVTVYSFGLVLFAMYEQLSTSVSSVMLPTVSNILQEENGDTKVQGAIVGAGRIQFILLGAAVVGFSIVGKEFIHLWLGEGFGDVYYIALILMIPSLFELCVNVCLSVLRAKNMLGFRTAVLVGSTALNAVVTIVGVHLFGYFAAAVGTALSFIIGSLIIMNMYYKVKLKYPMLKIYKNIIGKTWICLGLAAVALYASSRYFFGSWKCFIINVAVFVVVYGITLILFGFNSFERKKIPLINKIFK